MEFHEVYRGEQTKITLTEGMKNVLEFCRQEGIFTGIITNGFSRAQWNKVKRVFIWKNGYQEAISLYPGMRESAKPDPGILILAEQRFGLDMKDTWFIGDTYAMQIYAGAIAAGWKSIWLNRDRIFLPDGKTSPDYTVSDEEGLLNILLSK